VKQLLGRLLSWALVVILVHAAAFMMVRSVRGGPFDSERDLPPEVEQALLSEYHLDEALPLQYLRSLKGLLRLEFGPSLRYRGHQVEAIIADALPLSLMLGLGALLVAMLVGIPAGIFAASRRARAADHLIRHAATIALSLPNFVIAGALIAVFSFQLSWLPPAGQGGWSHLVMPILALGLPFAAQLARLSRNSALEALESPAAQAARARGLGSGIILRRHILRRALLPVVAFLGPAAAGILTGSLVIEQVFALPGLGAHFVQAALNRDYTLALGVTVTYTAILGLLVLIGDLLLAKLDPQVDSLS